jgi:hypothetical protein
MTTRRVDNAHKPSITPSAMPTLCPMLVAVETSVSGDGKSEVMEGVLLLREVVVDDVSGCVEEVVEVVLLGGTAMSEAWVGFQVVPVGWGLSEGVSKRIDGGGFVVKWLLTCGNC